MTQAMLVRRIAARPDIVFEALVTAEGIGAWWASADVPAISAVSDPRVGGRFEVRFATTDRREHVCTGEFLEIARPEHLVMSWRWIVGGEPDEATASRVWSSACDRSTSARSSRSFTPSFATMSPRAVMKAYPMHGPRLP